MKNDKILFLVDAGRDKTIIHRVNLSTGEVLSPRIVKGRDFLSQAVNLVEILHKDKCHQIVFEKMGIGLGLYDSFRQYVRKTPLTFNVTAQGEIVQRDSINLMGEIL